MNIFRLVLVLLWIAWLLYWLISAAKAKRTKRNHNWFIEGGLRLAIIAVVILFLKVPFFNKIFISPYWNSFYSTLWINFLGLLIFLAGLAISIWARVSLGINWGMPMTLREKPDLVTSGPYHYVRHPIYTGIILAMIGTTMVVTIFWIVPLVLVSCYFIYSSKIEEKDMEKQFPVEYKKYKNRTKSLIPFIY